MKKIKSILAFVLALSMCASMAACGSNSNDESSKTETSSAATTEATTEESTEEASEDSAETTSTVATASDSPDESTTADASDSTAEPVSASDITFADVDTCFSNLNGKTLDEIKSYVESTFPVTDCQEKIGAYSMPKGNDKSGLQIDMYTWNFSSPVTIEGVAFDYIAISMGDGAIYRASFNKYDSDTQTASDLKTKAESYGQKTSNEYADSYNMNCGEVSINLVSETETLGIDHSYQ